MSDRGVAVDENPLDLQWERYRAAAVPPDAGRFQVEAMRNAFYTGASAVLATVATAPPEEVAGQARRALDSVFAGCVAYRKRAGIGGRRHGDPQ